jgi:hypothetical protein
MKITKTADGLALNVYSRFLFRFWGVVFIAAGLVFLLPLLVNYQISCKEKGYNTAKQCVLNTNYFKLYKKENHLGELRSAVVSNFVEGRANTIQFCLLLITNEGYVKIPNVRSKKNSDIIQVANTVDNYIKNSLDESMPIPRVESWWTYLKIVSFILIGFGSLLFRLITIYFNKKTKTITIAAKNIINIHETKIALKDVKNLIIEEHGKHHKEYSLALILNTGEELHLPGVHDSSLEHIEGLASQIETEMGMAANKSTR